MLMLHQFTSICFPLQLFTVQKTVTTRSALKPVTLHVLVSLTSLTVLLLVLRAAPVMTATTTMGLAVLPWRIAVVSSMDKPIR